MTEQEMMQTWCPDARATAIDGVGNAGVNRGEDDDHMSYCLCLGRRCSSWRWERVPNPAYAEWYAQRSNNGLMTTDWHTAPPSTIHSTTDGYCGRTGAP